MNLPLSTGAIDLSQLRDNGFRCTRYCSAESPISTLNPRNTSAQAFAAPPQADPGCPVRLDVTILFDAG